MAKSPSWVSFNICCLWLLSTCRLCSNLGLVYCNFGTFVVHVFCWWPVLDEMYTCKACNPLCCSMLTKGAHLLGQIYLCSNSILVHHIHVMALNISSLHKINELRHASSIQHGTNSNDPLCFCNDTSMLLDNFTCFFFHNTSYIENFMRLSSGAGYLNNG